MRDAVLGDGEPWWIAADVCAVLELDPTATRRLDEDEKGLHSMQTPGGTQQINIISESGLFSLVLGSRKPEAKAFKKWVTSEVLPAIRKTGRYAAPGAEKFNIAGMELDLPKDYSESLRILATVAERAKEMAPKAAFYDRLRASMQEPLLR